MPHLLILLENRYISFSEWGKITLSVFAASLRIFRAVPLSRFRGYTTFNPSAEVDAKEATRDFAMQVQYFSLVLKQFYLRNSDSPRPWSKVAACIFAAFLLILRAVLNGFTAKSRFFLEKNALC